MKDGTVVSKIVPMLKQGAGVVTGRNHVHYVVTEFGVADLYGKSVRQRVRCAHQYCPSGFPDRSGETGQGTELDLKRTLKNF